jgi:hypothetical protein
MIERLLEIAKTGDLQACRYGLVQAKRRNDFESMRLFAYYYILKHPNGARFRTHPENTYLFKTHHSNSNLPTVNHQWNLTSEAVLKIAGFNVHLIWTEENLIAVYFHIQDMLIATGHIEELESVRGAYRYLQNNELDALKYRYSIGTLPMVHTILRMITDNIITQGMVTQHNEKACPEYNPRLVELLLLPHTSTDREKDLLTFLHSLSDRKHT